LFFVQQLVPVLAYTVKKIGQENESPKIWPLSDELQTAVCLYSLFVSFHLVSFKFYLQFYHYNFRVNIKMTITKYVLFKCKFGCMNMYKIIIHTFIQQTLLKDIDRDK